MKFEQELPSTPSPEDEKVLCQYFKRLLPALPDNYRVLLQRIDLEGEDRGTVATDLHLTRNNLTVRLHCARKHLRDELTRNWLTCATHGCLDCPCGDDSAPGVC